MDKTFTLPAHGATDAGPEPLLDFSSNAHPLGPCPTALRALGAHDPRRYPDPSYARLRGTLGGLHGVESDRIVVGAGAAELIHRIARTRGGTVQHRLPGFGEYAHAARCAGLPAATFAQAESVVPSPGTLFLCLPDNPDGFCPSTAILAELADRCTAAETLLVLDLAYLPLLESPPLLPGSAVHLHAPNKSMGLVGARAAYAVVPTSEMGRCLSAMAPSWVVGTDAVGFLEALAEPDTRAWLRQTAPEARRLRRRLAQVLRNAGFEVRESEATHLVARHPDWLDSTALASAWRSRGIRVRDTTSMGLPGWIRLAARPEGEIERLAAMIVPRDREAPCRRNPSDRERVLQRITPTDIASSPERAT